MDSQESPPDVLRQNSVNIASHTRSSLQTVPNYSAPGSRPFLHVSAATGKLSDFDAVVNEKHSDKFEPMRKMNPFNNSAPPRLFYRTFWRSVTVRLRNLKSIEGTLPEERVANKIEIQAQCSKQCRTCRESEKVLDIACEGM